MYRDYVENGGKDQQVVSYFVELEKQITHLGNITGENHLNQGSGKSFMR